MSMLFSILVLGYSCLLPADALLIPEEGVDPFLSLSDDGDTLNPGLEAWDLPAMAHKEKPTEFKANALVETVSNPKRRTASGGATKKSAAKVEKVAKSDAKASLGDLDLDAALKKIDDEDAGLKADIQANRGAANKLKAAAKLKLAQEGDDADLEKIAAEFQEDKAQAQGLTAKFEKIPKKGVAAEESSKVVAHKSPKGKLMDSDDEDEKKGNVESQMTNWTKIRQS
jgi:hypothetical protein